MEKFDIHILGCGSALPTSLHNPSSQVINLRDKLYMIDCGEGTQMQFRKAKLKFSKLNHIFISHLHGDHCFGLIGLISTLGLLGRTQPLHIYAHKEMESMLNAQLSLFCKGMGYEIEFHTLKPKTHELIYEDRSVSVYTIPLKHRIPCSGFLFVERQVADHIKRDMIDFYKIPNYAINGIKQGEGWTTPEGKHLPHELLTTPADPARKYAYCSDTAYLDKLAQYVKGVDLLYHEATFSAADSARAKTTFHSTAKEAALVAHESGVKQLCIGHYSARVTEESTLLKEAKEIFPHTISARELLKITL